jgi:hypothetical protein
VGQAERHAGHVHIAGPAQRVGQDGVALDVQDAVPPLAGFDFGEENQYLAVRPDLWRAEVVMSAVMERV